MFEKLSSLIGKEVHHFSHNDMDGYAPQVLSKLSSVNVVSYNHCGYSNFERELETTMNLFGGESSLGSSAILITDIAPKSLGLIERLNNLQKAGLVVVLLDHHDTSKWISEKYPEWAWIDSKIEKRLTCATEIYDLYLKEKELTGDYRGAKRYLEAFVEQVRLYDTWDWAEIGMVSAKELNSLLYVMGPTHFLSMQLEKIIQNTDNPHAVQYTFNSTESLLVDIENRKEAKYIDSRAAKINEREIAVDGNTYKAGIVFADQYHSTLGNELNNRLPHLDMIMILDLNSGKGSMRTIHDHVHVGEIAKAIAGGGGHQKAAGFEYQTGEVVSTIEDMLGISPQAEPEVEVEVEAPIVAKSWKEKIFSIVK